MGERTLTDDFQATMPGGQKLDKQTFISATKDILKSTPALYTRTAAISFKDNPLKVGWAADVGGQPAKITANFAKGSGLKKVISFEFEATVSVRGRWRRTRKHGEPGWRRAVASIVMMDGDTSETLGTCPPTFRLFGDSL